MKATAQDLLPGTVRTVVDWKMQGVQSRVGADCSDTEARFSVFPEKPDIQTFM